MLYYVVVVVLLFLVELFYFRLADRFDIIDKSNERSSHKRITLRGGGIIFYFGALAYFMVSGGAYPWLMLGLTLISLISFIDRPTSQLMRLFLHFSAMALMWYLGAMVLVLGAIYVWFMRKFYWLHEETLRRKC